MNQKRLDFCIEEAGCLIWVAPRNFGGISPQKLAEIWEGDSDETVRDLVLRGAMLPLSLYQDDGYSVRFVLGDLTAEEEAEWVARAVGKLDAACGEVLVSGILTPDFDREFQEIVPAEPDGSYWAGAYVSVPPGQYRVEVYSYPPGDLSSGWGMITNARSFGKHPALKPEKAPDYFKRTRPGEQPPPWINDEPEDGPLYVDFIVRLAPLDGELPPLKFEDDVCVEWEFRKPETCPRGIRCELSGEH